MRPLLLLLSVLVLAASEPPPPPTVGTVPLPNPTAERFFAERIYPVLQQHCFDCHAGGKRKGGVKLETPADWAAGGPDGAFIEPGNPDAPHASLLKTLRHDPGEEGMPPDGKLPDAVIADFRRWIEIGAPWPTDASILPPPPPPAPPAPFFGRLHPAIVHLPIAALALALLTELLAALRLGQVWTPASTLLLIAGLAGGVAAAFSGGALEAHRPHPLLERHELLGWLTNVAALLSLALLLLSKWAPAARWTMRVLLLIAVVLSAWTGHLGGEMVHGPLW